MDPSSSPPPAAHVEFASRRRRTRRAPWSREERLWIGSILALLALVCGWNCRCGTDPHHVDLIVPVGFTGAVCLVERPDGVSLEPVAGAEPRRYEIRLPDDGVLVVRNLDPVTRRHTLSVRRADGSAIPSLPHLNDAEEHPADTVVHFGLGVSVGDGGPAIAADVVCPAGEATDWNGRWNRGEIQAEVLSRLTR